MNRYSFGSTDPPQKTSLSGICSEGCTRTKTHVQDIKKTQNISGYIEQHSKSKATLQPLKHTWRNTNSFMRSQRLRLKKAMKSKTGEVVAAVKPPGCSPPDQAHGSLGRKYKDSLNRAKDSHLTRFLQKAKVLKSQSCLIFKLNISMILFNWPHVSGQLFISLPHIFLML